MAKYVYICYNYSLGELFTGNPVYKSATLKVRHRYEYNLRDNLRAILEVCHCEGQSGEAILALWPAFSWDLLWSLGLLCRARNEITRTNKRMETFSGLIHELAL